MAFLVPVLAAAMSAATLANATPSVPMIDAIAPIRQHQHRRRELAAQAAQHLNAVHLGHHDIEDDGVEALGQRPLQAVDRIARLIAGEAIADYKLFTLLQSDFASLTAQLGELWQNADWRLIESRRTRHCEDLPSIC